MRENQLNTCNFETMALSKTPKSSLVSVSSNVYYGYQPVQIQEEPMQTEPYVDPALTRGSRKRCRTTDEQPLKNWKRHRQNGKTFHSKCINISDLSHWLILECAKLGSQPRKMCSPTKTPLEEDLLRETHGCSYYHWISANNWVLECN